MGKLAERHGGVVDAIRASAAQQTEVGKLAERHGGVVAVRVCRRVIETAVGKLSSIVSGHVRSGAQSVERMG